MGATKLAIYPRIQIRKSDVAKAVAVPARITILKTIIEKGRTDGLYLQYLLKLSQPTVHHHLMILKSTGLIKGDFFEESYYWFLNAECADEIEALQWFLED